MINWLRAVLAAGLLSISPLALATCQGHLINPVTDICWSCLFPLSLGSAHLVGGHNPDTENPSSPLQVCPSDIGARVGLAIGYWEPFATVDVVADPYCFVNLGGLRLNISGNTQVGGAQSATSGAEGAFYQVHWYKYPLIAWLNLLTSVGCFEAGDADIGYASELDPTWDDDGLEALVSPESSLFANAAAQIACAADAAQAAIGAANNTAFWCMGAQGSSYPLTGSTPAEFSPLQNSLLLAERMAFKLHRLGLILDSSGENQAICHQSYRPVLPKNRYRYELMNPHADARGCHPFGRTVLGWQLGKLRPNEGSSLGYLIWRKRNCVFL